MSYLQQKEKKWETKKTKREENNKTLKNGKASIQETLHAK